MAVARAVAGRPSIPSADEPTGNLASKNGEVPMRLPAGMHAAFGIMPACSKADRPGHGSIKRIGRRTAVRERRVVPCGMARPRAARRRSSSPGDERRRTAP